MTAAERRREAEEAGQAYQVALGYLGAEAMQEAMSLWREMETPAQVEQWLSSLALASRARRQRVRSLTYAYYRLSRALRTGRTVTSPYYGAAAVSLTDLRLQFQSEVSTAARRTGRPAFDLYGGDDDGQVIEVDDIDVSDEEDERDEEDAEGERIAQLVVLADYRRKKARARDEAEEEKIEATAATLSGSVSQKAALGGGRASLHDLSKEDGRVIGYVRVSGTGNPCPFCAMLISRGLFFYSSRKAASTSSRAGREGESYHTDCYCYPEPVYSKAQYLADPRFAMNREFAKLWEKEIASKGYSGNDALNAWRRYLNHKRGITATQRKAV